MARKDITPPRQTALAHRLQRAFQLLDRNKVAEAKTIFKEELAHDPHEATCLVGIALIHYKNGEHEKAIEILHQALREDPQHPLAIRFLGIINFEIGELEKAEPYIEQLIEQDPNPYHLRNLAIIKAQKADYEKAIELSRKALALDPNFSSCRLELAQMLRMTGQLAPSMQEFKQLFGSQAEQAAAVHGYALCLVEQGKKTEALEFISEQLIRQPNSAALQTTLASILNQTGEQDDAALALQQALELEPRYVPALLALADIYYSQQDVTQAMNHYQDILAIEPNLGALINLANIAINQKQWDIAKRYLGQALTLSPNSATALVNLGTVYHNLADFDSEMSCYTAALTQYANQRITDIPPQELFIGFQACKYNLARLQLLQGDWVNGWQNFQARKYLFPQTVELLPNVPYFNGSQDLKGCVLYLLCEQEFIHTVACLRFGIMVKRLQVKTILITDESLSPLFKTVPGVDQVIMPPLKATEPNSYQVSVVDLPYILGVDPNQMENFTPYLTAAAEMQQRFLAGRPAGYKHHIALCWHWDSKTAAGFDSGYPSASQFSKLATLPSTAYVALGAPLPTPSLPTAAHWQHEDIDIQNYSALAAKLSTFDLIITLDNRMAHVCGALNIPCWLLVSQAPDWYWQLKSQESCWYSSVRLFRQTKLDDWSDVLKQVRSELTALAPGGHHE